MCCGTAGSSFNPIQVDHVIPRSIRPDLSLEASNCQVLCRYCNLGKSWKHQDDFRQSAKVIKIDKKDTTELERTVETIKDLIETATGERQNKLLALFMKVQSEIHTMRPGEALSRAVHELVEIEMEKLA
jgi:hypothetical protein